MQAQRPVLVAEQRQKLNPRMLQSIKILAMPVAELTEEIQAEIEANPALEVLDDHSEVSLESYAEDKADGPSDSWEDENADFSYSSASPDDDSKRKFLEGAIALPESLQEHLLAQLCMLPLSPATRELGERLIQNLDESGFHTTDPYELCAGCPREAIDEAMAAVRALDPCGTCVADYRESLLVQAQLDPEAPEGAIEVLRDHLDSLEKGRKAEVRKALKLKEGPVRGDPRLREVALALPRQTLLHRADPLRGSRPGHPRRGQRVHHRIERRDHSRAGHQPLLRRTVLAQGGRQGDRGFRQGEYREGEVLHRKHPSSATPRW